MTKEQLQGMLNQGYNLNQIAAIYMISRTYLEMLLNDTATSVSPTGASGKVTKSSTPKTTAKSDTAGTSGGSGTADRPLFENEPGL